MDAVNVEKIVAEYAEKYPPGLNVEQASEIAGVSKSTIYAWRSRGLLNGFSCSVYQRTRILRDSFVRYLSNSEKLNKRMIKNAAASSGMKRINSGKVPKTS